MIEVSNLSKSYGPVTALDEVSFHVGGGEIIGLLGPNGAGKTTLMRILAGCLQPDAGTVLVSGMDVVANPTPVQKILGYLPENSPLYPEFTVQSSLRFTADMRGMVGPERERLISEAIRATGLQDRLTQPIGQLSKGYRQRVGLAQAILHRPKLLILDEPTNGLDPTQIVEVRRLIRKLSGEATVILSTHILAEVEAACDRALIIVNGRIRADARLADLASSADAIVTIIGHHGDALMALGAMPGAAGAEAIRSDGNAVTIRVEASSGADLCPAVYDLCREHGWRISELRHDRRTLESVFNELARAESAQPGAPA